MGILNNAIILAYRGMIMDMITKMNQSVALKITCTNLIRYDTDYITVSKICNLEFTKYDIDIHDQNHDYVRPDMTSDQFSDG